MECAKEIYNTAQQRALLPKWRSATRILGALRDYEGMALDTFGFGLQLLSDAGKFDVRKTILTTLHLNTVILTLRPFVILRGKLRQKNSGCDGGPILIPSWLDGACDFALGAVKQLIHYLYVAITENYTIKAMLFNHVFLENCCAVLSYEMLHDRCNASTHLPWVYHALHCLLQMRQARPVQYLINMLQKLLSEFEPAPEINRDIYRESDDISRDSPETP
ncbi:hypothetical protein AbraIFM66950_005072 [Aspergillus brasiliensis]|nr:hypothetical protein AbraIFM66950_005072 [Aspergillus brasiliensis]